MKKRVAMVLCLIWSIMMIGCSKESEGTEMTVYYVNIDGNALVQKEYTRKEKSGKESVEEVIDALKNLSEVKECKSAFPDNLEIEEFRLKGSHLELVFNTHYTDMNKSTEVLLRAAVVQTMVQIPDVSFVSFYIGEEPLKNADGTNVGMMRPEDFVQNTGSSLKSYQSTDVKLYFATKDGTMLSQEKRSDVHYNINTSVEKLVVEQLMKGTTSDKRSATVPSSVKLLGVSVKEGICYVNFDSSFLSVGYNQKPEVTIYSIVNSIIGNGSATKVQILVEGSSDVMFMGTVDLSEPLEWNADLIEE